MIDRRNSGTDRLHSPYSRVPGDVRRRPPSGLSFLRNLLRHRWRPHHNALVVEHGGRHRVQLRKHTLRNGSQELVNQCYAHTCRLRLPRCSRLPKKWRCVWKRGRPQPSSYAMHPSDHMSQGKLHSRSRMTSGARYVRVVIRPRFGEAELETLPKSMRQR